MRGKGLPPEWASSLTEISRLCNIFPFPILFLKNEISVSLQKFPYKNIGLTYWNEKYIKVHAQMMCLLRN